MQNVIALTWKMGQIPVYIYYFMTYCLKYVYATIFISNVPFTTVDRNELFILDPSSSFVHLKCSLSIRLHSVINLYFCIQQTQKLKSLLASGFSRTP